MADVTVTNPELVETKQVDDRGRVYLGTAYSGDNVRIVVERVDDE